MGLIQKRDERDVIDGIEVIGRGEGPDGLEQNAYDLVPGQTAEDISGTTARREAGRETEPDPELMDGIEPASAVHDGDAPEEGEEGEGTDALDTVDGGISSGVGAASEAAERPTDAVAANAGSAASGAVPSDATGADAMNLGASTSDADADAAADTDSVSSGASATDAGADAASGSEIAHANGDEDATSGSASADGDTAACPAVDSADDGSSRRVPGGAHHAKLFVALGIIAVIVAAIVGYVLGSGGLGAKGTGSATIAENQLDATVATWSYNGATHNLTAREAIETQVSLDYAMDEDGTYLAPSADSILSYVRNQIMLDDAEAKGIEPTDDELTAYMEERLGTSDYDEIADQYHLSKEQAKNTIVQQVTLEKLYEEVAPISATAPEAPTEPADGNTEAVSKEYTDYIINLAGDEWDAEKGTWASTDGVVASALDGQEFTADGASYAQAQQAYYAAYSEYAEAGQEANQAWTDYANGLFAKARITVYGLYA